MDNILNVVLLTTGRSIELVTLEIITQCEKVGVLLLSCTTLKSYINKKDNIIEIDNIDNTNNSGKKCHSHPCLLYSTFSKMVHSSSIFTVKDCLIPTLENCILIRHCFEEIILYSHGLNNLNKLAHEYNNNNERIINVNDIILIGRRLKDNRKKKLIQQFNNDKLLNKCINNNSKKRKLGINDIDQTSIITDINIIPSNNNNNNNKIIINKDIIGNGMYILSDLRFISQMDEVKNLFYICKFICNGGYNSSLKLMKSLDSYGNNWMKSTNSFSTTRMDFIRCYLAINAAKITYGDIILDPFVGSGAILDAITILYGDRCISMSTDIERSCCYSCIYKSNNYSSQVRYGHDSIVNDVTYCSFRRESLDAIVCDPPYSFRTSKLNNNMDTNININDIKSINNMDNNIINKSNNNPHLNILHKLLLFASYTLRVGKRLVFWWWYPNKSNQFLSDQKNYSIKNDEIYQFLQDICINIGCIDMKIINISADDAGLGSNKDSEIEIDVTINTTDITNDIINDEDKCNSWKRYLIIFEKIAKSNNDENVNNIIEEFKPLVNLLINPAYLDIISKKTTTCNKVNKRTIPMTEFEKELFKSTWTGDLTNLIELEKKLLNQSIEIQNIFQNGWNFLDMNSTSLLQFAAGYGKLNIVMFLIKKGININYISNDGTALIRAARFSHFDIVKFLLNNGAEIHHTDNNGFDAISHATQFNHVSILQLLFLFIISNNGSNNREVSSSDISFSSKSTTCLDIDSIINDDLNVKFPKIDSFQLNIIHYYLISFNNSIIPSPIHLACQWGSLTSLQFILSLYSIDENNSLFLLVNLLSKNKETPLMLCCKYGHLECCKLLINNHADIHAIDSDGYNILSIAKIWSRDKIVEYITPLFEINIEDN